MTAGRGCVPDSLFLLVEGRLPAAEEPEVRAHLAVCATCREELQLARLMHDESRALQGFRVDPQVRARLWQALQPQAQQAATELRQRAAWTMVLGDRRLRRALVAAAGVALAAGLAWVTRAGVLSRWSLPPTAVPVAQEVSVAPPDVRDVAPMPTSLPAPVQAVTAPATPPAQVAETRGTEGPDKAVYLSHSHAHPHALSSDGMLHLACGGVVDVGAAHLQVVHNGPHAAELTLGAGRVALHVPHLPVGGSLLVRTEDAVVHVKGTRFTVDKQDADSTEVRVQEGTVWVEPRGRGREWHVLHAGGTLRVASERSWLRDLTTDLDDAIGAGRLEDAQELAQRYLEAAQEGADADEVRLRLAGIYLRLGKADDAARLFRAVAEGQGPPAARDNALAMLAWACRQRGRAELEQATWQQYLDRFAQGLHAREAMLRLVELTCGQGDPVATRVRQDLEQRFGSETAAQDVLARCTPKAAR